MQPADKQKSAPASMASRRCSGAMSEKSGSVWVVSIGRPGQAGAALKILLRSRPRSIQNSMNSGASVLRFFQVSNLCGAIPILAARAEEDVSPSMSLVILRALSILREAVLPVWWAVDVIVSSN